MFFFDVEPAFPMTRRYSNTPIGHACQDHDVLIIACKSCKIVFVDRLNDEELFVDLSNHDCVAVLLLRLLANHARLCSGSVE